MKASLSSIETRRELASALFEAEALFWRAKTEHDTTRSEATRERLACAQIALSKAEKAALSGGSARA